MSAPTLRLETRLRLRSTIITALGVGSMIVMVGALFPAVGDSIGKLDVPEGVEELLGGADYGTITGWMRSEIGAVYGPLVVGAIAITAAAGSTAGEEESGILALVLGHPVARPRLMLEKAAAVLAGVVIIALGIWLGLIIGVAVAGGGISFGKITAVAVHLALFGALLGSLTLALAALTGRRGAAAAGAASVGVVGFLINGFAPLVDGLSWAKYLSPFYYYAGEDPIGSGIDPGGLAVLAVASALLIAMALHAFARRDLRG